MKDGYGKKERNNRRTTRRRRGRIINAEGVKDAE